MDVRLSPSALGGTVAAVSSKSDVHRALIAAACADRPCRIKSNICSKDMEASMRCLNALGAKLSYEEEEQAFSVVPVQHSVGQEAQNPETKTADGKATEQLSDRQSETERVLDCAESGSTLRFLIPVAAALGGTSRFIGHGRLPERPVGVLLDAMTPHGVHADSDHLPLCIKGKLSGGDFLLPGNISSQFVTGLLLAFPLLAGRSRLKLSTELESRAYVDMTLDTMQRFGCPVTALQDGYAWQPPVQRGQSAYLAPKIYEADGDWSNAAFFLAADALNVLYHGEKARGSVCVTGLRERSVQGDRKIAEVLNALIAYVSSQRTGSMRGCVDEAGEGRKGKASETGAVCSTVQEHGVLCFAADVSEIPDLAPILSVVMALAPCGHFQITNAARLRLKECDRLSAMADALGALSAKVTELPDGLLIEGSGRPQGGVRLRGYNDHRVVMALSIAAAYCTEPVSITDAEAVRKSYPDFFRDYRVIGGLFDGI